MACNDGPVTAESLGEGASFGLVGLECVLSRLEPIVTVSRSLVANNQQSIRVLEFGGWRRMRRVENGSKGTIRYERGTRGFNTC